MYTSLYTMLEDGYKILRSFWIKQHWTQACSYRGRLKSRWREDLFHSKSASFSRMFRWLLWLEIVMYTSFYTMLEDGYKILRSFWIKQHWTQACSYLGRLKSRWREDLLQSKSASFLHMFRWLLWLEIVMYTSFYTMLENGYKFLRRFWIKQHWTQACSYRGTAVSISPPVKNVYQWKLILLLVYCVWCHFVDWPLLMCAVLCARL